MNKPNWEKEFENRYGDKTHRMTFYTEQQYYWNKAFYNEIKNFISNLLLQSKQEKPSEEWEDYEKTEWAWNIERGFVDIIEQQDPPYKIKSILKLVNNLLLQSKQQTLEEIETKVLIKTSEALEKDGRAITLRDLLLDDLKK